MTSARTEHAVFDGGAVGFTILLKFSSIRAAIYNLLKMCAMDWVRFSFPSSNIRSNCPEALQHYYRKYWCCLHDSLKPVTLSFNLVS